MRKAISLLTVIFSMTVFLSGCKDIQIFEEKTDPNQQIHLNDTELNADTYYIKEGTKFVAVYRPNGNNKDEVNTIKRSRVFWMVDSVGDEALVPSHYAGELVAYASEYANIEKVTLERFKDLGNSIGVYGGELKNDGYYHIKMTDKQVKNSSFKNITDTTPSDEIRIESINGNKITSDMIDKESGVFLGLEKGMKYKIGFFSGTYYYEADVIADTHFLQAYEIYIYGKEQIYDTKHGYLCFETPQELKSGWYNINGQGLFKYYGFKKGERDISAEDMNINYYNSEAEMLAACSAEYSFILDKATLNLNIEITTPDINTDFTIFVKSPDQTTYSMKKNEEKEIVSLTIAEAVPGKWKINVLPKNIEIDEINVYASEATAELTLEETDMLFVEEDTNVVFCVEYSGEGVVNGLLVSPSGETYVMKQTDAIKEINGVKTYKITYTMPYVAPGTYVVRVYHHPVDTTIGIPYTEEGGGTETDVIVIKE